MPPACGKISQEEAEEKERAGTSGIIHTRPPDGGCCRIIAAPLSHIYACGGREPSIRRIPGIRPAGRRNSRRRNRAGLPLCHSFSRQGGSRALKNISRSTVPAPESMPSPKRTDRSSGPGSDHRLQRRPGSCCRRGPAGGRIPGTMKAGSDPGHGRSGIHSVPPGKQRRFS